MEPFIELLSKMERVGHQADKDEGGTVCLPLEDRTLDEEREDTVKELDFND
jgi:hypothetical protein